MSETFRKIYLARHGETAWSLSGQHTGLTDMPLTEKGEWASARLGKRLQGLPFARVFTSPLQRALRTCELAGFGAQAKRQSDLVEWNYGQYEGLRTSEIHSHRPDWQIFSHGAPGGETPDQVRARAERVLQQARLIDGDVLIFSSGHFLRVLAARWLGLPVSSGVLFMLSTASLSILGYENSPSHPVIRLWNDTSHLY
jgi:broad specificity phosphatase PhoE